MHKDNKRKKLQRVGGMRGNTRVAAKECWGNASALVEHVNDVLIEQRVEKAIGCDNHDVSMLERNARMKRICRRIHFAASQAPELERAVEVVLLLFDSLFVACVSYAPTGILWALTRWREHHEPRVSKHRGI